MEGTSLAGSGVSIAYVAKEIEHVCTSSTVGPSAAGWTKEAYIVHGSCNALKLAMSQKFLLMIHFLWIA